MASLNEAPNRQKGAILMCLSAFLFSAMQIPTNLSGGTIPIMITEHPVASKTLTDRKGVEYDVMRWHSGDKYLILGRERVKKGGCSAFMTYVK